MANLTFSFCSDCNKLNERIPKESRIVNKCPTCGKIAPYTKKFSIINVETTSSALLPDKVLHSLTLDGITQKIKQDCPKCHRDYMSIINLPSNTAIACICGHIERYNSSI